MHEEKSKASKVGKSLLDKEGTALESIAISLGGMAIRKVGEAITRGKDKNRAKELASLSLPADEVPQMPNIGSLSAHDFNRLPIQVQVFHIVAQARISELKEELQEDATHRRHDKALREELEDLLEQTRWDPNAIVGMRLAKQIEGR